MTMEDSYRGGWVNRSIEMSKWYKGNERGVEAYELIFGLNDENLDGKSILNLGTGPKAQFSQDIKKMGIHAFVVELSPDFVFEDVRKKALSANPSVAEYGIASRGQALPFADESFDVVFMVHVLDHIKSTEILFKLFNEISRVMKRGGKAYIGPVYSFIRAELNSHREFEEELERRGVKISSSNVPEEYGAERLYSSGSGVHYGDMPFSKFVLEKINGAPQNVPLP